MLATPYARLQARVLALSGTNATNTDAADLAQIAQLLAARLRSAWEHYWWPETMDCEARPYRADYAAGTTYAADEEVYYPTTGLYYVALGATTGNVPTNATYWTPTTTLDPAEVPYAPTGYTPIGKVRQVSTLDPQTNNTRRLPFVLTGTGVRLLTGTVPNVPFVWYQLRAPDLSGAATTYAAGTAYAVGDRIYFASGTGDYEGDYWTCLEITTAGQSPITHPVKWERIEIPAFLVDTLAYGAAADLLRAGGKADIAAYLEDKAETCLLREQSKIMAMQRQTADGRRSADNPPAAE